jgi:hypothetical protein
MYIAIVNAILTGDCGGIPVDNRDNRVQVCRGATPTHI